MAGLSMSKAGLADLALAKEQEARAAGADGLDILMSQRSGMDARDIMYLRAFTRARGLMIIVRCPKRAARAFHGELSAKTFATKGKTNETGTVYGAGGHLMVSDYDMMSVWRATGTGWQKIFVSALTPGAARGPWSAEARDLVREMNSHLVTRLQHGCQDDFHSPNNPGVKMADHFLALKAGEPTYLPDPIHCENYYAAHGLFWPYGAGGKHCGHGPAGSA